MVFIPVDAGKNDFVSWQEVFQPAEVGSVVVGANDQIPAVHRAPIAAG